MPIHKKDLAELVSHGIIPPETATLILNYYLNKKQSSGNPVLAVFGALGGLLVGLGIILIFAHNWDNFTRLTKTALAFTPLLLSQILSAFVILKNKSNVWRESAAALLFFSVGASIALVAQIYNIPGDLSSYLLSWTVLCTPLMYLLRSRAAVILHLIFATWYVVETGYWHYPSQGIPYPYLVLLAAMTPYYIHNFKNNPDAFITRTLHWLVPISLLITFGSFITGAGSFSYILYMALLCLMYNIGTLPYFENTRTNGYQIIGLFGIMIQLFTATFSWIWSEMWSTTPNPGYYGILVVLLAASGFIIFKYTLRNSDYFKWVTFIFPVIYLLSSTGSGIAAIVTNILVLLAGIHFIIKGIKNINYAVVNFGLIIITILTACRFFDTELSFVVRGLMFVSVGGGFFAANYIVSKRKKITANTVHHEN